MTPTDPAGDFPEGDVPDPVLAPHHDLTAMVMGLSGTVREHHAQLSGKVKDQLEELSGTTKEHHARLSVVESAAQAVSGLIDRVADLEIPTPGGDTPAEPVTAPADQQAGSGVAAFDLRELIGWVRENVAMVVEREIPASRSPNWCRQWWRHAEAIARLEATRRCWLDASSENANLSVFFQHLDHQLGVLMGEGGPFSRCREGQHTTDTVSTRCLGQDDPAESLYAEFDRLRATTVAAIPTTPPATPTGSHDGGNGPVPAPLTGAAGADGGVIAADLTHRRNGRGR